VKILRHLITFHNCNLPGIFPVKKQFSVYVIVTDRSMLLMFFCYTFASEGGEIRADFWDHVLVFIIKDLF
jgi:hypothetical protein